MTDKQRPFEIERLDHLVLRTDKLDQLLNFYELLGCKIERDLRGKMGMVQLRLGASMIDLIDVNSKVAKMSDSGMPPAKDGRNLDHFAIRVEPFDQEAILEFCKVHNIEAQPLPISLLGADGFGPAIYIRDPNGNRIELKGPPDADQTPPVIPKNLS